MNIESAYNQVNTTFKLPEECFSQAIGKIPWPKEQHKKILETGAGPGPVTHPSLFFPRTENSIEEKTRKVVKKQENNLKDVWKHKDRT